MIHKVFVFLLLVLLTISFAACHSERQNNATRDTVKQEAESLTTDFIKKLEGVWGANNDTYTTFEFVQFYSSGKMVFATYCGYADSIGEIQKITDRADGCYEMDVLYPAYEDLDGELVPEDRHTFVFSLNEKEITFEPGTSDSFTYEFMGKDLESAIYTYENV